MSTTTLTNPALRGDDESACGRLLIDFACHMDRNNYPEVLGLFTEDAMLDRAGLLMRGRTEIREFLERRPAQAVTRHLCTNVRVQLSQDDVAEGVSYVQFFQAPNDAGVPLPLKVAVTAVAEYIATFVRQHGDWRIQHLRIRPVFQG